jgi:hypothetical protein
MRDLPGRICHYRPRETIGEPGDQWIAPEAVAIDATDFDYHAITDACTGESVASNDSRPNSLVRIRKSRSQGPAFGSLGDGV